MPDAITIQRPAGIIVPEQRQLTATFLDRPEIRGSGAGDGSYTLIGHAAVFDRLSLDLGGFRERVQRGFFRTALDDPTLDCVLVVDHSNGVRELLASTRGGTLELSEDPKGLRTYANVAGTNAGRDTRILIERGDIQGMSFSFRVADGGDSWSIEDSMTVRTLLSGGCAALGDVSVVSFPAYPQTDLAARSMRERGFLIERRARLDLFDPTDGHVRADEVARVRSLVGCGLLELAPEARSAFDRAQALIGAAPPVIATQDDLRAAVHAVVRAPDSDQRRRELRIRAGELDAWRDVPANWGERGELLDGQPWQTRETYNDVYQALAQALDDLLVDSGRFYYVWVQDFTDTNVIFCAGGDLWSAPYTIVPGGAVTIGEPENVRPVTDYVPMDTVGVPAEQIEGDTRSAPARDQLARRMQLMRMSAEL